jgi:hypothetical protein
VVQIHPPQSIETVVMITTVFFIYHYNMSLTTLRNSLANLYPQVADIRRVVFDTYGTTNMITNGNALTVWLDMLEYSEGSHTTDALVNTVLKEYPNRYDELVPLIVNLGYQAPEVTPVIRQRHRAFDLPCIQTATPPDPGYGNSGFTTSEVYEAILTKFDDIESLKRLCALIGLHFSRVSVSTARNTAHSITVEAERLGLESKLLAEIPTPTKVLL